MQVDLETVRIALNNYKHVKENMLGRIADSDKTIVFLAHISQLAGDGDYLEIGTLYGGCAIAMSLIRTALGIKGKTYVIDPLDGYYRDVKNEAGFPMSHEGRDDLTGFKPNRGIVEANAGRFGAQLNIIQAKSYPWPEELKGHAFGVSYIDGDHWNEGPINDWNSVKYRSKWVVFDDHDDKHPAVRKAVELAGHQTNQEPLLFDILAAFNVEDFHA